MGPVFYPFPPTTRPGKASEEFERAFQEFLTKATLQGWTEWDLLEVILQLAEDHLATDAGKAALRTAPPSAFSE